MDSVWFTVTPVMVDSWRFSGRITSYSVWLSKDWLKSEIISWFPILKLNIRSVSELWSPLMSPFTDIETNLKSDLLPLKLVESIKLKFKDPECI